MNLRCNIGEIIIKNGYKKGYVAQQIGVSGQQMSNWIVQRSYPTADNLFKLAAFLKVKVDELYSYSEE